MTQIETLAGVVRSLKGAPAAIFLAQVLYGGPQTTNMLCGCTGYSSKVVRQGLAQLERMGLAYRDTELRAWYLVPGTEMLALLHGALETAVSPGKEDYAQTHMSAGLSTQSSTGMERDGAVEESAPQAADTAVRGHGPGRQTAAAVAVTFHTGEEITPAPAEYGAARDVPTPPAHGADSGGREESSARGENPPAGAAISPTTGARSSASRAPTVTAATGKVSNYLNHEAASKQAHPKADANGRYSGAGNRKLMFWLSRGGIAPGSPKMREIMALNPDLEIVKAHVLERMAGEKGEVRGAPPYGVGLLIRKLLDGDPPPPMRCETCLGLPDRLGWCGCDYEDVIVR